MIVKSVINSIVLVFVTGEMKVNHFVRKISIKKMILQNYSDKKIKNYLIHHIQNCARPNCKLGQAQVITGKRHCPSAESQRSQRSHR